MPRNRRFAILAPAVLLLAAAPVTPPAPLHAEEQAVAAAASRLAGVPLPKGTLRLTDRATVADIEGQLRSACSGQGMTLGEVEILVWAGPGYRPKQDDTIRAGVAGALKRAGFEYVEKAPEGGEGGALLVTALHHARKAALFGVWIPSGEVLILAWGRVKPDAGAVPAPASPTPNTQHPSTPPSLSAMPKLKAEPGVATGWVADHKGRPVSGAQVTVYSLTNAGKEQYAAVKTDARGVYRAPLTAGYVYEVGATVRHEFDGSAFRLPCNPVQTSEARPGRAGIRQDFVLAFTGLRNATDADPDESKSYLGGRVWLYYFPKSAPPDAVVHVTLEPVGPLADGSTGRTLTFRRTVDALRHNDGDGRALARTRMLHDIPLGVYRASAWVEAPGGAKWRLRLRAKPGGDERPTETAETVELHFLPDGTWGGIDRPVVTLEDPE